MTVGELVSLAESTSPPLFWHVGRAYFIRTVTHYITGRLVGLGKEELILSQAAWIADTGRYSTALTSGVLNEVEPYPANALVLVGRGAIVDATEWAHELPTKVK